MRQKLHFISGLPRSGSTLLSALLRQNPRFHAGMTSPVAAFFNAMLRQASQENEGAVFITDDQRERLLRGVFTAFYDDFPEAEVVFDTSRGWTTKLAALSALFPDARTICCVRNPAWVIDSMERLVQRNYLQPSRIFGFETGGNIYSRVDGLGSAAGMVGYAYNSLREAVYGPYGDRLLLVRYDTLVSNPLGTLGAIYNFIGEELFAHDPGHIEPDYAALEFDARIGMEGLHELGSSVRAHADRKPILPPDIWARFSGDAFWDDPAKLPNTVRIV